MNKFRRLVGSGLLAFLLVELVVSCNKENNIDQSQNNTNNFLSVTQVVEAGKAAHIEIPGTAAAVDIPANAVVSNLSVKLTLAEADALALVLGAELSKLPLDAVPVGNVLVLEPHGSTFGADVTVTVPHQPALGAPLPRILRADPKGAWAEVPRIGGTATASQATTRTFSYYVAVQSNAGGGGAGGVGAGEAGAGGDAGAGSDAGAGGK